jgi:hypothetical protein
VLFKVRDVLAIIPSNFHSFIFSQCTYIVNFSLQTGIASRSKYEASWFVFAQFALGRVQDLKDSFAA